MFLLCIHMQLLTALLSKHTDEVLVSLSMPNHSLHVRESLIARLTTKNSYISDLICLHG